MTRPVTHVFRALWGGLLMVACAVPAFAAEGTITVSQQTPLENYLGEWTIINPEGDEVKNWRAAGSLTGAIVGDYLLVVDPPSGMRTKMTVKRNGELVTTETIPRTRFTLGDGETWDIVIAYELSASGEVTVITSPPGVGFTLEGPDKLILKGTTPASFNPVPVGQYSVTFREIKGCPTPPAKSDVLREFSRISLSLELECSEEAMARISPGSGQLLNFVSVTVDGQTVVFTDVPQDAWFATYVHAVARIGVMSGYNNSDGAPAGRFGPGDPLNLAQLSKIANEIAGIDEMKARGTVQHPMAKGTWFEPYYISAEALSWKLFLDPAQNPARLATRGEVIATLLQALDVSRFWAKGETFTDVSPLTPYADSIETAAADGIVSGFDDGTFRPSDPINRAELSKILAQILQVYGNDTAEIQRHDPRDLKPPSARD